MIINNTPQIYVSIDIGCRQHSVAIGLPNGDVLDEFDILHRPEGFKQFFERIEHHHRHHGGTVVVAMEGYNGYARPLDSLVRQRGYRLYNINNLKLARFKEIFPGATKKDRIDARKGFERAEKRLLGEKQFLRRQHRIGEVAAHHRVAAAGVGPEFVDGFGDAGAQAHRGVLRQVVGQQRGAVEKQRQEIFDARGRYAFRHILVDLAARRVALETFAETSLIEVRLETGKRNQIRIQARLRGHTLVGETRYVYGREALRPIPFERQALHAHRLAFRHPGDGRLLTFEAPLPRDLMDLVTRLRRK